MSFAHPNPFLALALVKIFINCVETELECFKKVVEEGLKQSEKRWEMDTKSKLFTLDGAGLENKCEGEKKILLVCMMLGEMFFN